MLSRRQAIRRTLVFSSAVLTARWNGFAQATPPATVDPATSPGIHFLAVGDFGTGDHQQAAVAGAMANFARQLHAPLSGVLALGDNFYKPLTPARFQTEFENMYPATDLPCPFYAILGNHDYGPGYDGGQGLAKAQMQLDYSRDNPQSRWKLPAKWYAVEFPAINPVVKIIFIDTNYFESMLTPQEKLAQQRFLDAEFQKGTTAPWTWVVGHHPLVNDSKHGDDAKMIKQFTPTLVDHPVSFYVCGHDHTMQHLEMSDFPLSFIISGGGGAPLHELDRQDRGYGKKTLGFTHFHVTPAQVSVQFIDADGQQLHAFQRTAAGAVSAVTAPV